jgi:hypothetical protein
MVNGKKRSVKMAIKNSVLQISASKRRRLTQSFELHSLRVEAK